MKKSVKILAFALAVMGLTVACNNNAPTEELVDTIVPVDTVVEEVIDSTPVEEVVVEEPVKKATTPKKKTTKKEEPKTEVKVDASKMSVNTASGTSVSINKQGGASVSTKSGEGKVDASKMSVNTNSGSVSVGNGGVAIKKN